ncbi:hypothetical protein CERZMDRAFT_100411 [Cercospora zeae-maydis SCOH1-5]|uniref:N-acetyltransferase domain-containing protein n=1 Tax=Cercospora zeae-maydis SCOH1-5 TaxID=717836 RepID=A0A6A6F869_9PEZI|nr:hypothetical protein CERZMDRAFT_100411 [Cercospora zeae-maydis SCOH1-5]
MGIKIQRIGSEQADICVELGFKAFQHDLLNRSVLPDPMTPEQEKEYLDWRKSRARKRLEVYGHHLTLSVESTGEVLGYAGWNGPAAKSVGPPPMEGRPTWVNIEPFDELLSAIEASRKELGYADRTDYWYLQSLAVHPDHWGKGVAGKLLQYSLQELVDRDGVEALLESTPAARRTYTRWGFQEVKQLPLMNGQYISTVMVRPAQQKTNEAMANEEP